MSKKVEIEHQNEIKLQQSLKFEQEKKTMFQKNVTSLTETKIAQQQ